VSIEEHQHSQDISGTRSGRCTCGEFLCRRLHAVVDIGCLRTEGHGGCHFNWSTPELVKWYPASARIPTFYSHDEFLVDKRLSL